MKVILLKINKCSDCSFGQKTWCSLLAGNSELPLHQLRPLKKGVRFDCPLSELEPHSIELIQGQIEANAK